MRHRSLDCGLLSILARKDRQGHVFWAHESTNFYSSFWQDLADFQAYVSTL